MYIMTDTRNGIEIENILFCCKTMSDQILRTGDIRIMSAYGNNQRICILPKNLTEEIKYCPYCSKGIKVLPSKDYTKYLHSLFETLEKAGIKPKEDELEK